jgi:hemolysin activation/secretion protein
MKIKLVILVLIVAIGTFHRTSLAQVPAAQQASGQESLRQLQENDQKFREKLEHKRINAEQDSNTTTETAEQIPEGEKALITTIHVTNNTILSNEEINKITYPFEGQTMSLRDMQKVADLITDKYRSKGFITSRAVLPPQQVVNNTLEIQIVEGVMGSLEVRGNRYFKKGLFLKRVSLKQGKIFNYNKLRNDLNTINQYPDRNVKTVITPGKESGQTDVVLEVKDRLPIHMGMMYDNYGSRYIGKSRFTGTLTHNNLLGFDDILTLQYQGTNAAHYQLVFLRYLVPITKFTEMGVYTANNKIELGKEFAALEARGKSKVYGVFVNQTLLNEQTLKIVANAGFDYKDVFNFIFENIETSRDRLRIAKLGFNVDYADAWGGRNIFNNEIDFGIPDIMSGLHKVDSRSSRAGAGGQFTKDIVDFLRLQRLPLETAFLFKSQAQFSSTVLPATEQYQLGGIANLRGFASGEAVGDSGQTITTELSVPLYLIPHSTPVPFSKAKLYDSLRTVFFYDWGHVSLRNPLPGETQDHSLSDIGVGLRLNLPENLSVRLDFAWPVSGKPSDDHNEHTWLQVKKDF